MRLPFLRPKTDTVSPPPQPARGKARPVPTRVDDPTEVEAARTQARRRLVGALVLLVIGVLGFPVLFETQPRPLPIDTPMEVAHREATVTGSVVPETPVAPGPRERSSPLPPDAGTEESQPASAPVSAPVSAPSPVPVPVPASAPAAAKPVAASSAAPPVVPAAAAVAVAVPKPAAVLAPVTKPANAAAPPEPAASTARWVVQAGAYSEAGKLRDARAKIEQLGLKTYTQVIDSDKGSRTRVRVGPYASKAEAEATAAKVKKTGLPAAVIAL